MKLSNLQATSSAILLRPSETSSTINSTPFQKMKRLSDPSMLFFLCKVAVTLVVFWNHFCNALIVPATTTSSTRISQRPRTVSVGWSSSIDTVGLRMAGGGMGMGSSSSTKVKSSSSSKKKGGKNKKSNGRSSTSAKPATTPFDVGASLIRLEKKFDELKLHAARQLHGAADEEDDFANSGKDDFLTSEYVVTARAVRERNGMIPDWVPIAQMCLKRPESSVVYGAADPLVRMAVSAYCRELSAVAAKGAHIFSTVARNDIQYGVEPVDSFYKHVYDEVVDNSQKQKDTNPDEMMTKSEARAVLGLDDADGLDKSAVKQAYRKLSFELHPDRFEGTADECEAAKERFARVKLAYETLTSGVRGQEGVSWYESLGGRARTGFVGPVELSPLSSALEFLESHKADGALVGLDPDLTQSFVARNLRSA